jgi:hypothetical protein
MVRAVMRAPNTTRAGAARQAAIRRWTRARFGAPSFRELGLPGGEIVDAGLADLAAGRETIESLAISEAAPRLRREGVPVPRDVIPDPSERLYRLIEQRDGALAHARFTALLRQLASFADACSFLRERRSADA